LPKENCPLLGQGADRGRSFGEGIP
jgi:hypothetical protein